MSSAILEEWKWIRYSRILRPGTADILKRDPGEEWWVLPGIRGVLQLRKGGDMPKIHGLVVREPGRGDGTRLVRAMLGAHPRVWVGAHPSAVQFYRKLGFVEDPSHPTTPSEVPLCLVTH